MEELAYTLIENRTIVKENGGYRLDETASQHQVPDTIQGIVAGRMDRLEDNIKTTLQVASVIGRSFVFRILKTIPGSSEDLKTYYKKAFALLEQLTEDPAQKKNKLEILHAMLSPIIILNFPEDSLGLLCLPGFLCTIRSQPGPFGTV